MLKVKLKFVDFWSNQNHENSFMFSLLSERFEVVLSETPDYVLYSVNGFEHLKYDCIRIFFAFEQCSPDFDIADYAVGYDYLQFSDRYFRMPLYAFSYSVKELNEIEESNQKIDYNLVQNRKFCSYLSSNKKAASKRDFFFNQLSKANSVDSGGSLDNNMGFRVKDKFEFIKNYNFNIAFENGNYEGYVTEKIADAFKGLTIPIYSGDPLINNDFYEESFINIDRFESIESAIEYIMDFSIDKKNITKMLNSKKFKPHVFYYRENLFAFLSNIYSQELEKAKRRPETYFSRLKIRNLRVVDVIFYSQYRRLVNLKIIFRNLTKNII